MRRVHPGRALALAAEAGLWHWFVLAVSLFAGAAALAVAVAVALLDLVSVVAFDAVGSWAAARRARPARLLAWYVAVQRTLLGLSQGPGLWSAFHIAPRLTAVVACAAAAWLVGSLIPPVRRWPAHPTLALSALFGLSFLINAGAFAGWMGVSCAQVLERPGVSPLLLFEPVPGRADSEALLDRDCEVVRVITLDPVDHHLLVACGPEVGEGPRHAALRIDPERPSQRIVLLDRSAIEALAIPGSDLVAVSIMGRDVVRLVDRATFAPRGEVPLTRPLGLAWDEQARRLLVGHEGEPGCVAAIDPFTARRIDGHVARGGPTLDDLRSSFAEPDKSRACLPDNCSPSHIVPLADSSVILVGNSSATCTWQAMSYDGLERVYAAEWLFPARDVVRSPSGDEVWVALSFPGKIAVLDAKTLEVLREIPTGYGAWWFDWLADGDVVVGDYVTGELRRLDPIRGTVEARTDVGSKIREVLFDPSRNRLYVASRCGIYTLDPALALPIAQGRGRG